jgi:hypothetical protein
MHYSMGVGTKPVAFLIAISAHIVRKQIQHTKRCQQQPKFSNNGQRHHIIKTKAQGSFFYREKGLRILSAGAHVD